MIKGVCMKLSAALLCASVLSGSLNALPPLAETKPPFEKSETAATRTTRYFPGKGICRFRGDAVQVLCYRNGTPQFHFVKPDDRFGGLAVSVDGKSAESGAKRETRCAMISPAGENCLFPCFRMAEFNLNPHFRMRKNSGWISTCGATISAERRR